MTSNILQIGFFSGSGVLHFMLGFATLLTWIIFQIFSNQVERLSSNVGTDGYHNGYKLPN
jgi:hypothetical protein